MNSIYNLLNEEEITEIINSSIKQTLVIENPQSVKYTLEKIKASIISEVKRREEIKNKK